MLFWVVYGSIALSLGCMPFFHVGGGGGGVVVLTVLLPANLRREPEPSRPGFAACLRQFLPSAILLSFRLILFLLLSSAPRCFVNDPHRINTSRPAANRRGSPSSTAAAAAAASSFSRRRPSLPLRRRSLSPERARRSAHAPGEEQEDRERASTSGNDGGPPVEGGGGGGGAEGVKAPFQRPIGLLPRHRSHSSLPWSFFRPRSASLSSRDGGAGTGAGSGGSGGFSGSGGVGGEVGTSLATAAKGSDLRQQQQRSGSGGDNSVDSASFIVEKQAAVGEEGHATTTTSATSPGAAAAAAVAAAVSPSTTPGSHVNREASVRSVGSTATADAKEGVGENGGHGRPSAFFQSLVGHRHGEQDGTGMGTGAGVEEERVGPIFDLPLVKNGLPRGRIRGRCTLVLGSSNGGSLLRMGSVGALTVGAVASVGGVGVARVCGCGDGRYVVGDGGGPSSSTGGRAAHGGGGRKKNLARFFSSGRRGRSRSASNVSRSRSGSASSRSPVKRRGVVDRAATFPPPADNGDGGCTGAGQNGRPRFSTKSKSDGARPASRRLGGGERRRDSSPSGCVLM